MHLILFFSAFLFISTVQAAERTFLGGGLYTKNPEKESTRWTLADWLTQKREFKAMDQWLALNKSLSIFELNLEGGQNKYDYEINGVVAEQKQESYNASIYWSIFGLEYQFVDSNENYKRESAQFNLRLLGTSSQTTNLVGYYGMRKWTWSNPSNELDNQYAGARLKIYLVDFLGVTGEYQKHFRAEDKNDKSFDGERYEFGAFIDVLFFSIYGKKFKEKNSMKDASGTRSDDERDGAELGVRFYL